MTKETGTISRNAIINYLFDHNDKGHVVFT